eukprot:gene7771-957_t
MRESSLHVALWPSEPISHGARKLAASRGAVYTADVQGKIVSVDASGLVCLWDESSKVVLKRRRLKGLPPGARCSCIVHIDPSKVALVWDTVDCGLDSSATAFEGSGQCPDFLLSKVSELKSACFTEGGQKLLLLTNDSWYLCIMSPSMGPTSRSGLGLHRGCDTHSYSASESPLSQHLVPNSLSYSLAASGTPWPSQGLHVQAGDGPVALDRCGRVKDGGRVMDGSRVKDGGRVMDGDRVKDEDKHELDGGDFKTEQWMGLGCGMLFDDADSALHGMAAEAKPMHDSSLTCNPQSPFQIPIPSPSQIPIPSSSQIPIPGPSPIPSLGPSQIPSPSPSQISSPSPSQVPSSGPSQVPVPSPQPKLTTDSSLPSYSPQRSTLVIMDASGVRGLRMKVTTEGSSATIDEAKVFFSALHSMDTSPVRSGQTTAGLASAAPPGAWEATRCSPAPPPPTASSQFAPSMTTGRNSPPASSQFAPSSVTPQFVPRKTTGRNSPPVSSQFASRNVSKTNGPNFKGTPSPSSAPSDPANFALLPPPAATAATHTASSGLQMAFGLAGDLIISTCLDRGTLIDTILSSGQISHVSNSCAYPGSWSSCWGWPRNHLVDGGVPYRDGSPPSLVSKSEVDEAWQGLMAARGRWKGYPHTCSSSLPGSCPASPPPSASSQFAPMKTTGRNSPTASSQFAPSNFSPPASSQFAMGNVSRTNGHGSKESNPASSIWRGALLRATAPPCADMPRSHATLLPGGGGRSALLHRYPSGVMRLTSAAAHAVPISPFRGPEPSCATYRQGAGLEAVAAVSGLEASLRSKSRTFHSMHPSSNEGVMGSSNTQVAGLRGHTAEVTCQVQLCLTGAGFMAPGSPTLVQLCLTGAGFMAPGCPTLVTASQDGSVCAWCSDSAVHKALSSAARVDAGWEEEELLEETVNLGRRIFCIHPHAGAVKHLLLPPSAAPAPFNNAVISIGEDGSFVMLCAASGAVLSDIKLQAGVLPHLELHNVMWNIEGAWLLLRGHLLGDGNEDVALLIDTMSGRVDRLACGGLAVAALTSSMNCGVTFIAPICGSHAIAGMQHKTTQWAPIESGPTERVDGGCALGGDKGGIGSTGQSRRNLGQREGGDHSGGGGGGAEQQQQQELPTVHQQRLNQSSCCVNGTKSSATGMAGEQHGISKMTVWRVDHTESISGRGVNAVDGPGRSGVAGASTACGCASRVSALDSVVLERLCPQVPELVIADVHPELLLEELQNLLQSVRQAMHCGPASGAAVGGRRDKQALAAALVQDARVFMNGAVVVQVPRQVDYRISHGLPHAPSPSCLGRTESTGTCPRELWSCAALVSSRLLLAVSLSLGLANLAAASALSHAREAAKKLLSAYITSLPIYIRSHPQEMAYPCLQSLASCWLHSNVSIRDAARLMLNAYTKPHVRASAGTTGQEHRGGQAEFPEQVLDILRLQQADAGCSKPLTDSHQILTVAVSAAACLHHYEHVPPDLMRRTVSWLCKYIPLDTTADMGAPVSAGVQQVVISNLGPALVKIMLQKDLLMRPKTTVQLDLLMVLKTTVQLDLLMGPKTTVQLDLLMELKTTVQLDLLMGLKTTVQMLEAAALPAMESQEGLWSIVLQGVVAYPPAASATQHQQPVTRAQVSTVQEQGHLQPARALGQEHSQVHQPPQVPPKLLGLPSGQPTQPSKPPVFEVADKLLLLASPGGGVFHLLILQALNHMLQSTPGQSAAAANLTPLITMLLHTFGSETMQNNAQLRAATARSIESLNRVYPMVDIDAAKQQVAVGPPLAGVAGYTQYVEVFNLRTGIQTWTLPLIPGPGVIMTHHLATSQSHARVTERAACSAVSALSFRLDGAAIAAYCASIPAVMVWDLPQDWSHGVFSAAGAGQAMLMQPSSCWVLDSQQLDKAEIPGRGAQGEVAQGVVVGAQGVVAPNRGSAGSGVSSDSNRPCGNGAVSVGSGSSGSGSGYARREVALLWDGNSVVQLKVNGRVVVSLLVHQ